MGDKSAIEWTEATWNPTYGCTKVSPACANCYIERTPPYRMKSLRFDRGRIPVQLLQERLEVPLRWKRPRRIFVDSLSDLFHEEVPDEFIYRVFSIMAQTPRHTYQVLTKRPERMRTFCKRIGYIADGEHENAPDCAYWPNEVDDGIFRPRPLPNVWLGVTVENQRWADERIPLLLDTPAAVRFVSAEPLLGPLDIAGYLGEQIGMIETMREWRGVPVVTRHSVIEGIRWVIVGGESGPGDPKRRLVEFTDGTFRDARAAFSGNADWRVKLDRLQWVRSIRDQCVEADVAFHFKQWGGKTSKSGGRELDGRTWDEFPS